MGGSAWTLAWKPAVFWVRALDGVASWWLFARTLLAGLILGAGWAGEDLGAGGICVQQSFLLFSFLPLVFLLSFSGNKPKEEKKLKKASLASESSRRTGMSRGASTPQDGDALSGVSFFSKHIATTSLFQALGNVAKTIT